MEKSGKLAMLSRCSQPFSLIQTTDKSERGRHTYSSGYWTGMLCFGIFQSDLFHSLSLFRLNLRTLVFELDRYTIPSGVSQVAAAGALLGQVWRLVRLVSQVMESVVTLAHPKNSDVRQDMNEMDDICDLSKYFCIV